MKNDGGITGNSEQKIGNEEGDLTQRTLRKSAEFAEARRTDLKDERYIEELRESERRRR
jgi:hypothetical protein